MANEVTFRLKIVTDGSEAVQTVTMDTEELGRVVQEVSEDQERLNTRLLDINQAQAAIENVTRGFRELASAVASYTGAYAVQEEAEAKLAQVMRNTMDATSDEVESIKALCAAQQDLGVIGDEVQLSGAQELATYLGKKQTLEQLIPVMNDMLAQQYGLSATQENAAQIATMLGKVMEGQTEALSRYGYKFDETQEQILKFGTEEQRAAVLASVVGESVGGMNAALAETDSGKVQQVSNTLGDLREVIGGCLTWLSPFVSGLGEVGMAANGLSGLTNGFRGLYAVLGSVRTAQLAGIVTTRLDSQAKSLLSAMNVTTTASTWALRASMIALYATITGGLFLGVQALISLYDRLTQKEEESAEASERVSDVLLAEKDAYANAKAEMERERSALQSLIESKGDTTEAVSRLNTKYGESFGYMQSASDWYATLTANSESYCRQLSLEAKMKVLASKGAEVDFDLEKNLREQERLRGSGQQWTERDFYGREHTVYGEELKAVMDEAKALAAERRQLREMENETLAELSTVKIQPVRPSASTVKDTKGGHGGGNGGGTGGSRELSLVGDPKTYADLTNNVKYYEQELAKCSLQDAAHQKQLLEKKSAAEELVRSYDEVRARMSGIALTPEDVESGVTSYDRLAASQRYWQQQLDSATTAGARQEAQQMLDKLSEMGDRLDYESGKLSLADLAVRGLERALASAKMEAGNALTLKARVEAEARVEDLQHSLDQLTGGRQPTIKAKVKEDGAEKTKRKLDGAADAVKALGQSFGDLGGALELPELNFAGTLAQAIAELALGFAKASGESATLGPWAWLAFSATGVAQLAAVIASVKQMSKFAAGGIAYGPTLGLFGEYANARSNPEVVAPLDRLRSLVDGGLGSGRVEFRLRGRVLRGVLLRENRLVSRK